MTTPELERLLLNVCNAWERMGCDGDSRSMSEAYDARKLLWDEILKLQSPTLTDINAIERDRDRFSAETRRLNTVAAEHWDRSEQQRVRADTAERERDEARAEANMFAGLNGRSLVARIAELEAALKQSADYLLKIGAVHQANLADRALSAPARPATPHPGNCGGCEVCTRGCDIPEEWTAQPATAIVASISLHCSDGNSSSHTEKKP